MLHSRPRTLVLLASLIWYAGAVVLLLKAFHLVTAAEALRTGAMWPCIAVSAGLLAGLLKGKYLFHSACVKNLQRIASLPAPRLWHCYRPQFFVFLAAMILLGHTLSVQAQGHYGFLLAVAALDLSIGAALLGSSVVFWRGTRGRGGTKGRR